MAKVEALGKDKIIRMMIESDSLHILLISMSPGLILCSKPFLFKKFILGLSQTCTQP